MYQISPTLDCQNIVKSRKENNLPVYNFGLGANCIPQPDFYIKKVKEYAEKKIILPYKEFLNYVIQ